jgi:hypothetical protein
LRHFSDTWALYLQQINATVVSELEANLQLQAEQFCSFVRNKFAKRTFIFSLCAVVKSIGKLQGSCSANGFGAEMLSVLLFASPPRTKKSTDFPKRELENLMSNAGMSSEGQQLPSAPRDVIECDNALIDLALKPLASKLNKDQI